MAGVVDEHAPGRVHRDALGATRLSAVGDTVAAQSTVAPPPASRLNVPALTDRMQLLPESATITSPVPVTATSVGPDNATEVALPVAEHVLVAPPPATTWNVPSAIQRTQLRPESATNTAPAASRAMPVVWSA